jgi:hypothetical protein
LVKAERKAYISAIACGNPAALEDIRNNAPNSMARLAATRLIEELDANAEGMRPGGVPQSAGLVVVVTAGAGVGASGVTIEHDATIPPAAAPPVRLPPVRRQAREEPRFRVPGRYGPDEGE